MDSMDLMRKSEEIVVGSMRESGLAEEQAKSLEEQRQRFEEAKRTEIAGKGVKEPAKEQKVPLPWEMTEMLDEVLTWTKVKVETSAPVKAAANALKTAKTGAEVSDALATLATACANYIEKNGGKIFKSNRRKQVVRTLLEQLSDYENALSQNEMKQTGDNVPDALYWNGKEIKKTVFKEIQLLSSEKNEQPENDRIPAERFNAAYGEESAVPGFEDDAVLHMQEEELDGEAKQRLDLSRHLAAEREKLIHRRRSIRNIIEPRISKTRMIGTAEMFRTAEDKEALREWTLREKDGKNKGKYGFNWSLIDYSDNSVWSYSEILRTVQEAPIDEFLDEDDGDFASSFAEKYDRLCKYASADVILRITEEKAGNTHISNSQGFSVSEVRAKIKFFKEMREQYEDRLRLLSSPYYITQKAGDMAKYLGEEGEKEKEKVEDQKLLSYITLYQKVCGSDLALGKGKETKDHYKALLEESRKEQLKRDEEKVKDAFRRLKEGKAAEEAYKKEHAPQELVLSEEDAQLEKSEKQIELFNRQKALYLTGYPEDDVEFVKQIGVEVGGDLILGMDVNELNSMEKIFIEDILLNGKAGGMDIDHALLDELKGMIHDFIHVRREFIAECYAADFTCNMAEGMGIDLNNPLAEGSETLKSIKDYVTREGVPEVINNSVSLRRKDYSDKMTAIFARLIGAGYPVFPKYQDRVEKESAKEFSDDVKAGAEGSSFIVNGKEYKIIEGITNDLLKNAEGLSFQIQGKAGEELLKLLDEQQQLLERSYYVRKNYGDDGGQKFFISYSHRMYGLRQLDVIQRKIADILGVMENPLPESMTELLDQVLDWEKVREETSIPMKNAASALKSAKTKSEASEAMSRLALACTNYMEKNGGKMFKSSSRKTTVLKILSSIADFMAENDAGFYDVLAIGMANAASENAEKFHGFVKKKIMQKEGQKDFDVALSQKRQLERDRERIAENAYSSGRRAFKESEEYRKNEDLYSDDYATVHGLSMTTEEDRQKEYEKLKESTPQLSEEGYQIYERFRNASAVVRNPEYMEIYERAKHNYKKTQSGTFTREALNLLRHVNFDKNFKPISEDDKRNHEFNLKVLRAFENDDLETREKLIAEEVPRFWDHVEFPTVITKDDILAWKNERDEKKARDMRSILKARLDQWVDDFLKNGDAGAFKELSMRTLNWDSLKKLHPGVIDFVKANPGFEAKFGAFDFLTNYISAYSNKNYLVGLDLDTYVEETAGKDPELLERAKKDKDFAMDGLFDQIMEFMQTAYEHENDPTVAYKTDEKIQSEIDRRKEKIQNEREAEERRREKAEKRKSMEGNDGLLDESAEIYQSRQTDAYRNAIDLHTTVKRETLSVKEKKRNAKLLSDNVNAVIDAKVKLRMNMPLDIKKKVDYRSFTDLSDLAYLIGGQKELERLITETAGTGGYQALDYMTAQILKIDASIFDVSSDDAIAQNAVQLEKMARGIEAYRKMVLKLGGEEYFKYLSEKKLDGVDGDAGQMALCQMDSLLTISKYYRTRKLIMEDEGYIDRRREITTEEYADDSFETKRLKELQKTSDRLEFILKQSTWDVNRSAFRVMYGMDKKDYEDKVKEGKKVDLDAEEKTLNRLEHERFFVSPKWLQNALTIKGDITHYQGDNPAYAATLTTYGDSYNTAFGFRNYGTSAYFEVLEEQRKKVQDQRFAGSPVFEGGKDAYLSKLDISDNWSRMHGQIVTSLSYRRTTEELREMMDILLIQKRDEWDKIKDDPEAAAFYESAFKEKTMQFLEAIYANVKRVANSVGMQMLVMHPADLAMQVTSRLRAELYGATVATNVDTETNIPLVEKLFKENNADGRFLFDVQDFRDMGSVTANTPWKACNSGQLLVEIIQGKFEFEEMDITQKELEKQIFGTTGTLEKGKKLKEKALKELEDKIKKKKETGKGDAGLDEELIKLKDVEPAYFFLKAHPEVYNINTYCAKDPEGNYLFQSKFELNGKSVYSAVNAEGIRNVLEQGKLKKPKKEVLDKYEKSLKDRNMPGFMSKKDPYGIDLVRNNVETLIKKDKEGNPILKDGKLQFKDA